MRKRKKNRVKILRVIAVVLFLVVFGRLSFLQGIAAAALNQKAVESRTTKQGIMPQRGNIMDDTGKILATSVPTKTVFVEPQFFVDGMKKLKTDPKVLLNKLASILGQQPAELQTKCNSPAKWVSLAREVSLPKVAEIQKLNVPGIGFEDDSKRVYPMGNLMSSVLGFVNMSDHGAAGLELSYDKELYGQEGVISEETDARSRGLIDGVHFYQPPQDGYNLTLTLDSNIQYIVEQQLDELVKETEPENAVIVVMDPRNGKIVAMANRPSFDSNDYGKFAPALWNNEVVSWQYEPGSTFKIVTASAAIEEGTTNPDKKYDDPGYLKVGQQTITNWNSEVSRPGWITLTMGMEVSSNVVLGQVNLGLGKEKFFKYLRGFGFGKPTGVDLPGEASGQILDEKTTNNFELATMAFGQANAVTPLQLITAISAVANGGTLYKPYVVDKITDAQGNVVKQFQPQAVRQVISKSTAEKMKGVLEKVVTVGTGQRAEINGYLVAGKTGTAQKVGPDGKYLSNDYIASFAGFAPADNPRLVTLVIIDSPHKALAEGGVIAAPVFQKIMQQALTYLNVPPNSIGTDRPINLQPGSVPQAKTVVPERKPEPGEGVVPDLTGKTMSEAGELLSKQGFRMNFSGTGLATSQNYPPGKVLAVGTVITVGFSP